MASNNTYLAHRERLNPWNNRPYSENYHRILDVRKTLPVYEARRNLLELVEKSRVVVLEGETGSGKTTQVPQFLVEAGYTKNAMVCCTQPRRVAAMSVAKRVAEEMDVRLGDEVGYTIRFEDRTSSETKLKYLTDGMLLREAITDRDLEAYSVIVLDEAHERTLSTDILFGVLKELLKRREDLKLIIMSATLDTSRFRSYFDNCPLLKVPGRMFPVQTIYSKEPEDDYVKAAIRTATAIHRNEKAGDILIFLTGEEEIEDACKNIEIETSKFAEQCGVPVVLPLYSSLPPHQQQKVFEPAPRPRVPGGPPGRKIICATNVAETSLTIDGVVYVIDPGFSKQKLYNPRIRVESLLVQPISRASAKQRAGRAGRTQPGKCFRLYTEESFENELYPTTHPEVLRSNLGNVVLTLLKLGVVDLVHFDFMDPPAPETLMRALELLNYLGAICIEGRLTEFGKRMAEFPLAPELSAALIKSEEFKCSDQILTIVAMLSSASNWFHRVKKDPRCDDKRREFEQPEGDHITLLHVFNSFKHSQSNGDRNWCFDNYINARAMRMADNVRGQLARVMRRLGINLLATNAGDANFSDNIRQALLAGYFMQVAYKAQNGKNYITVKDQQPVVLHPSCALKHMPRWIFYNEFVYTKKQYVRTVSEAKGIWLVEIAPHYYELDNFPTGETKQALVGLFRKKERADERKKKEKRAKKKREEREREEAA